MDNRLKTLLILSPGFPKDEQDSTCVPPQQVFVKALKQTYPKLNIIVLSFQYPFVKSEYEWNGVKVIALNGQGKGRLFRLKTWLQAWNKLLQLNKEFQVIGLLSFWLGECALVASYFARLKKLKHHCWLLGQDAKAGNKYAGWINPKPDELIALSDFIQREFNASYGIKPKHVIPVGVDADMFGAAHFEKDIDILGVGSLIPLKQFHLFVELVGTLRLFYPNIKTMICGDGPERERLQQMICSMKLENNITLAGELPHVGVLTIMQRSKVLLHASAYEGFGAVCLEALYAGAHVVSFVKPMDADITNWHTVKNTGQMLQAVKTALIADFTDNKPVYPFPITDNARAMMQLFAPSVLKLTKAGVLAQM